MPRRRYPEHPRVCAHCGEHWTQYDDKPPRTYCSTTCRQAAEGPPATTGPVPPLPEIVVLPVQTRHVRARLVTLTCAWCRAVAEVEHFPGPRPRYCSPFCREEAQRDGAAERMRRMRERRQQAARTAPAMASPA